MRRNYKIFGIARSLYRIGSACVNFVVGQALEPMSQPASNELDTENTQAYKNGIFGITSSGNMPQSVQEDVVSHLDCKYEDLIKNAGIFVPKTTFEDGETGYDKNAVVYIQNNNNTITLYVSQVDNNKSTDLTDTNYWVQEATIPGLIDGSKLTLNNLSDTAKNNIKDIVNLDSSDFSLLKTSLDDIIPTNNKELNGDTITSATIVVPERINYLKTKLTPAPDFVIVDGEPSVDLSGCYLISMAQRNLITSTYNGDCKYYTYIEGSDTLILPTVKTFYNELAYKNGSNVDENFFTGATFTADTVDYIIESGSNANGFYKKYKSEKTIQGANNINGGTLGAGQGSQVIITLPTPTQSTNYIVNVNLDSSFTHYASIGYAVINKTTTGFVIDQYNIANGTSGTIYYNYSIIEF